MYRIGRWSFWSWFDFEINWSTFWQDKRDKRFLHIRSQWPWHLTFRPKICPLIILVYVDVSAKLDVYVAFLFQDNRMHLTDGRKDGVQHLMRQGRTFDHVPILRERRVCEVYDRQTDGQISQKKHFRWWNAFEDTCRMGCCSFWSWFDVNQSTFDKDMREKTIFTFSFPETLTFDL